jgi:hypothetical protein
MEEIITAPRTAACSKDLLRLLRELPKLGTEVEALQKDLHRITQEQPPLPQVPTWE